ncbi:unnamed protein product [Adineta ricciae]|uniref:Uncharacterized protein n=1 Tax=Adineta ricciae TaxID=249248 RepID=A0A815NE52_ADIRI|nr:unnamed protein product [Adineta ricciae]
MWDNVGIESVKLITAELPNLIKQLNVSARVFGADSAEIIKIVLSELVKQLPHVTKLFGTGAIQAILRDPYVKLFLVSLTIYQVYKTLFIIQQLDYNALCRNVRKFVIYPAISVVCLWIVCWLKRRFRNRK